MAKASFLIVTNLAIEMIIGAENVNENIEKNGPKRVR